MSDRSIANYLESVASASPTPGGGSVAATMGSLGCALGEMVCAITSSRTTQTHDQRLAETQTHLCDRRVTLLALASEDEDAYLAYRSARALPRETADEKQRRSKALAESLGHAAEVPLQIAERSCEALESLGTVAELGSTYALSDVATASYALSAAVKGALENVWVNLRSMKDARQAAALRQRAEEVIAREVSASSTVREMVADRT